MKLREEWQGMDRRPFKKTYVDATYWAYIEGQAGYIRNYPPGVRRREYERGRALSRPILRTADYLSIEERLMAHYIEGGR
jgi:hypothetical protein